jgi:hypothetical protein
MKLTLSVMLSAWWVLLLYSASSNKSHWTVQEQETIQNTPPLSSPVGRVVVDNVEGYVHVTGTTGSQVQISAHKVIQAKTDADLQQAKNEVKLEITEKAGSVSVYYDAPWRCNRCCCSEEHRHFYDVTYDIDIQLPRAVETVISTVNNGDIQMDGTTGNFDIGNVNGGIRMTGIAGSGDAHTVNGPIDIHFAKNPSGPGSFKSINGRLDFYFQADFAADLLFKTFNGQVYSDYEVVARVTPQSVVEHRGDKFVYHSNGMKAARVGNGGPELSFDTLNGDVCLHKAS